MRRRRPGWPRTLRALACATVLLLSTLTFLAAPAGADATIPPTTPPVDRTAVRDAVLKGLEWLSERQRVGGNWEDSPGLTGLIIMSFTGAGYDHNNRTVQDGLAYLRGWYNPMDGSLAINFQNYESAISLIALSAANDPEDADKLGPMTDFIIGLQFGAQHDLNETQGWYIGGWPNYANIPDLSNSQFGILSLQASDLMNPGVDVPERVWRNNTAFTRTAQNWPDVNAMPWAHNASLPSHGDGGFVYNALRSRTELGEQMFESYGSITAAGLYSYLASDHALTNPEVAAAREWLDLHYNLQENPRMGGSGLFYYLWTQARALAMSPQDWVVDGAGKLHDWRADLVDRLTGMQLPNGGWPANAIEDWWEGMPELTSMYAISALQAAFLMVPNPQLELKVSGADSVRFLTLDGEELRTDVAREVEVTGNGLSATDPELFRKLWIDLDGVEGRTATVSAVGRWGEDRQVSASEEVVLGKAGARVFVSTGGFAGPFSIHLMPYDRGPALELDHDGPLSLERGRTTVIEFKLSETTGENRVTGIDLISMLEGDAVADVDDQGISVAKGATATMKLTISVPEDAPKGGAGHLVFTSSTSIPVLIPVKYVDPEDGPPSTIYWVAIGILFLIVIAFIALPRMGRGR